MADGGAGCFVILMSVIMCLIFCVNFCIALQIILINKVFISI